MLILLLLTVGLFSTFVVLDMRGRRKDFGDWLFLAFAVLTVALLA